MRRATVALTAILALFFGCDDARGGPFQKRGDGWYYKDEALNVPAGERVVPLKGDFATAGDRVFYRAMPIDGADAGTFAVLSEHYAKDRASAYYADTHRQGQEYFLVKHTRVRRIEGADAATFQPLGYGHARDRVRGYYHQKAIAGSDGASFVALDDNYSKDASHVFYSDIDPRSQPIAIRSRTLASAQPRSFTVLGDGYAADSTRGWFKGEPLRDATPPLEVLEVGYARTATRVFYFGSPVPAADAATFQANALGASGTDASDARGPFYEGKRVK